MVTRRLQFNGALFDGRSAQKHSVQIELTPHHISITVPGNPAVSWHYSDIRWAAETTPFHLEHDVDTPEGKRLETLVVEDPDFYENCIQIGPDKFSRTIKRNNFNWKIFSAGILVLLLFFYGAFKFAPRYFVDRFVNKIPVEWEETLGDVVLSAFPVEKNPDPKVISLLQNILRLLKQSRSEPTPYDLKVFILPTNKINALALPGGNIIILRKFASGMLLALVMGDANVVMDGMVSIAGQLNTLGLDRKMEAEADTKGMELMLQAKINPQGMLTIFEKLLKEELKLTEKKENSSTSKKAKKIFSYLSTHPSAKSRLKKLENEIKINSKKFWIPLYPNSNWNKIKPKD